MQRFRTRLRGGGNGSPLILFSGGAQGVWYDPTDWSTLFQDSAGTTPVTATGQPVGLILDKSGRGNHASQATATSRPALQQDASGFYYLSFDGVDDALSTAAINFSTTQQAAVFAGVRKLSDAAAGVVVDLSNGGASTFRFLAPGNAAANYQFSASDATSVATIGRATTFAAPISNVVAGLYDLSASTTAGQVGARVNGAAQTLTYSAGPASTGSFVNQPLNIGRSSGGTIPLNGRIYGLLVVGKAASATEIASTERWVGQRMGISL